MSILATGLVLLSAILHATWNLLAKKVQGNAAFIWLYEISALVIFAPFVFLFVLLTHAPFSSWTFLFIIVSGLLELAYFLLLQRGYRVGDLSLVYPLARGTGPLITTVVAILVLQEHPTFLALLGTGCIVGGVILIALVPQRSSYGMLYCRLYVVGQRGSKHRAPRSFCSLLWHRLYKCSCFNSVRRSALARSSFALARSSSGISGYCCSKHFFLCACADSLSLYFC